MMRFVLAASVALTGCGEEPPFPEDYTTSWKQVKPCTEDSVHGGDTIRVFANDLAQPTYTDWAQRIDPELGTLPPGEMVAFQPGSVLLKAQYSNSNCSTLKSWTMMTRLEVGGDTANGNWRWEMVTPDEEGNPQQPTAGGDGCFACHQNYRRTDYAGMPPEAANQAP